MPPLTTHQAVLELTLDNAHSLLSLEFPHRFAPGVHLDLAPTTGRGLMALDPSRCIHLAHLPYPLP